MGVEGPEQGKVPAQSLSHWHIPHEQQGLQAKPVLGGGSSVNRQGQPGKQLNAAFQLAA